MKIRHRQTGEVEEVEPTRTVPGYGWRKACPLDVDRYYPKAFWEPVPEEVWEDVTAGCHVYQGRVLYDGAGDPVCEIFDGYQLRKVMLHRRIDNVPVEAIVIERKRPA